MLKKIILYIILFFLTFFSICLLALPIIFDLIFSIIILYIFRKKIISIYILNFSLIILVFFINLTIGKDEKHGYFYRGHEKYTTKNKNYEKNVSDEIYMPFGDIYVLDSGLNEKRELIKVPRLQKFITDSYGIRNDKNKIELPKKEPFCIRHFDFKAQLFWKNRTALYILLKTTVKTNCPKI